MAVHNEGSSSGMLARCACQVHQGPIAPVLLGGVHAPPIGSKCFEGVGDDDVLARCVRGWVPQHLDDRHAHLRSMQGGGQDDDDVPAPLT